MGSASPWLALFLILLPVALASVLVLVLKRHRSLQALYLGLEAKHAAAAKDVAEQDSRFAVLERERSRLAAENNTLEKYAHIADVEAEAERITKAASTEVEKAKVEVSLLISATQKKLFDETRDAREHAQSLTQAATAKAKEIVDDASQRAHQVAGEALEVRDDARKFEQIVRAMKNKIEGYGNNYLIPTASILDDLAERFAFADAGQQLKGARDLTKKMVKERAAATCEYVESSRRDTAIDFVVDAFNGKVDSILSRVKYDNAGTLEQQIRDAYTLVNHNGRAFRSAAISEDFLQARLTELKWATVAQELKLRDDEEQRRIREQIREEEKVRKECERAIRDAEKEEDVLKKAIEKVRKETEKASDDQREAFEIKLAELAIKLKEAEEKNQRAVSMAQQTRIGNVYVISNAGSFGDDVLKIGMTRRLDPHERVRELGDASVPFPFDVHAMIPSNDAPALEKALHTHFLRRQVNKVNPRKEFFRLDVAALKVEVEKLGISVSWTLAAEAREYRETQALEKTIASDPALFDIWGTKQDRSWSPSFDSEVIEDSSADEPDTKGKPRARRASRSAA